MSDPYATLGVAPDASLADIRRAWRAIALQTHPDRHPGDEDKERRFKDAAAAWSLLSDPQRRARYDRERHAPTLTPGDVSAAREAAYRVRDAVEEVARVVFEAVLPAYLARYERGLGAELVWKLIDDLDQVRILDLVQQQGRPGFGARSRAGTIRDRLRLRLDLRTRLDGDGQPRVASLTRVRERGLSWSAITVWVGSVQALGVTDPDALRTLLLLHLTREVARDLEHDLPEDLQVLAWRERTGKSGFPSAFSHARSRDTRHVAWVLSRIGLGVFGLVLAGWALTWAVQGYPPWPL